MSLDNKNSGDKWFAFELNNILKELRSIVLNILTLNENRHWDYLSDEAISASGSASSINDTLTMPDDANFAVIKFVASGGLPQMDGELIIGRDGITSVARRDGTLYSGSNWRKVEASLSGDTITITHSYYTSTSLVLTGTVYYYT